MMSIDTRSIKDYYQKRASSDRYATSPDFNLREVEIEYISQCLVDDVRILDAGCGNGYSTLKFAEQYKSSFIGLDFVPEMIKYARMLTKDFVLRGEVDFRVGDVTNLDLPDQYVDIVISQRCLLNLPSKELQWRAIKEIGRVLKGGGVYLMLEGTLQGLKRLNEIRVSFGLDPIAEADPTYNWFSNKFDENEMQREAQKVFSRLETTKRFGMYYFISRVLHPLLVAPDNPRFDSPINYMARRICSIIPDYEGIGHVALFVFKK